MSRLVPFAGALLAASLLAACGGGAGEAAPSAPPPKVIQADAAAATGRVSVSTEPAGSACEAGGYRVAAWYDANANGRLDEGETASTGFVCNGGPGVAGARSLVRTAAEPAGARCAAGGTRIDAGLDANGNGTLEDAEVGSTSHVCNGATGAPAVAGLFALAAEPPGATCPQGGSRVLAGADRNGNGVLDADEVGSSGVVCSAGGGLASLVALGSEAPGARCTQGGTVITSGRDRNGDGVLQGDEVADTRYVCNGSTGPAGVATDGRASLVSAIAEPRGVNCSAGGVQLASGLDANGNGQLDATEVTQSRYLCNGADGTAGRASLSAVTPEPAGANCPAGGSRLTSGIDTNGNGVLDAAEVSSTAYACNGSAGAAGTVGTAGLNSLVAVATEPVGPNCAAGGSRITAGQDTNRNGVLDAGEVSSTSYACNGGTGATGATGATGSTGLSAVDAEPAGANCVSGGSRIRTGLDTNASGSLEPGEVTGTAYVCNGNDTGLAWTVVASGPVAAQSNRSYLAQSANTPLRLTLPASPVVGDSIRVVGAGTGGWEIVPAASQWVDVATAGADAVDGTTLFQTAQAPMPLFQGACAISPDGRRMLVLGNPSVAYSLDGGLTRETLALAGAWGAAAWSADGSTALIGQRSSSTGSLVRITNDFRIQQTLSPTGSFRDAALSRDGRVMLVAQADGTSTPGALLRSLDYGATWTTVTGRTTYWRAVAVSDDGRVMLAGEEGLSLSDLGRVWISTDSGATWSQALVGESITSVAMTPDGRRLYAGGSSLWRSDDQGGSWQTLARPVGSGPSIRALQVSTSGAAVIVATGTVGISGQVTLYRSETAGGSWTAMGRTGFLGEGSGCVAMTRDGTSLFYAPATGTSSLWSTPQRHVTATSTGSAGQLAAEQYGAAELLYVGGNRWVLVSHRGTLVVR